MKNLPFPRAVSGLVTVRGKIYAVGGVSEGIYSCPDLDCYDPDTDEWASLSPMVEARFDPGKIAKYICC